MIEDRTPKPADSDPMVSEEAASAVDQETAEEQDTSEASPQDLRLVILLIVALGLGVAAYIYNKASSPAESPSPVVTSGDLDAGGGPQPSPMSRAEGYKAAVSREIRAAADFVYRVGGRDMIVASRPGMVAAGGDDQTSTLAPGSMFDVTKRGDGIAVSDFQRRFVYVFRAKGKPESAFVFRDDMPAIGLPESADPSYVKIGTWQESAEVAVIGVFHKGEAKAYPLRLMNHHEIVNDTIGGDPVVITWSPFSGAAGAALAGKGEGRMLFGSSGLAYHGDFLAYDRETESLWSPQLGRCVAGERADATLQRLHVAVVPLAYWKKTHPESLLLSKVTPEPDYRRIMPVPTPDYGTSRSGVVAVVGFDVDDGRLHPKEHVIGVLAGEKAKAYPLRWLFERSKNEEKALEDTIGETGVTITYNAEGRLTEARDGEGNQLLCTRMFWMYWLALHPDSEVFAPPRVPREATEGSAPAEGGTATGEAAPTAGASAAGSAAAVEDSASRVKRVP